FRFNKGGFHWPHFASWCKALSIGSLEIRIRPPKGWSNSKIRKMAPETARAETIKARMAVALGGASTLKPRKMIASQATRMISIGFEMDATDCATSSDRTWPISVARVDRKSTRLNSSHVSISYAVFCLKKKKKNNNKIHDKTQHHYLQPQHRTRTHNNTQHFHNAT